MSIDHCAIYEVKMNTDWFHEFEIDDDDAHSICVSSNILAKILATRQPSQHMIITYKGKPDNINIKFASLKKDGRNQEFPKEFSVPLMDVDQDLLNIPELEYSAEFGIGSKSLLITNEQLSLLMKL